MIVMVTMHRWIHTHATCPCSVLYCETVFTCTPYCAVHGVKGGACKTSIPSSMTGTNCVETTVQHTQTQRRRRRRRSGSACMIHFFVERTFERSPTVRPYCRCSSQLLFIRTSFYFLRLLPKVIEGARARPPPPPPTALQSPSQQKKKNSLRRRRWSAPSSFSCCPQNCPSLFIVLCIQSGSSRVAE